MKLGKEESKLLARVISYSDEALLSWAGYDSKSDWEEDNDTQFTRRELIVSNFEDIEQMVSLYEEEDSKNYFAQPRSKGKEHRRAWT